MRPIVVLIIVVFSCTSKKSTTGIVILCEVALGDMYLKRQAESIKKLKSGYHSTKGEGKWQPDPKSAVTMYVFCDENGLLL